MTGNSLDEFLWKAESKTNPEYRAGALCRDVSVLGYFIALEINDNSFSRVYCAVLDCVIGAIGVRVTRDIFLHEEVSICTIHLSLNKSVKRLRRSKEELCGQIHFAKAVPLTRFSGREIGTRNRSREPRWFSTA